MPPPDAGFLLLLGQRDRRTRQDDAAVTLEVNLVLDPGAPVLDELRFVKKNKLGPRRARLAFAPRFDYRLDSRELEKRMIESGVENVGSRDALLDQLFRGLQQKRRLADLTWACQENCSGNRRLDRPIVEFLERRATPRRQVRRSLPSPPGIELGEDGNEF